MPSAEDLEIENNQDHDQRRQSQEDGYNELTQTLEHERDRSQYDPLQDKEERRKIRQMYRKLITHTEENRRDYSSSQSLGLADTLEKANMLYDRVRNTQEATLDSKLLVLSADISTQRARNLRIDHQLFNIDEFVSKVRTLGRVNDDDEEELDWRTIGKKAVRFGKRVSSIDFMLGPLSVEKKQRKVTRQARVTQNKEDLVKPAQLQEGDLQQQQNETSNNVNQIYRILDERGPTNYLEFITNPESFSQTVENMFYVSFLIRNAVAEIDDSNGAPIIRTRPPPSVDELAEGLNKKQIIMSLDMAMWKNIIDVYGIQQSIIPTRQHQQAVPTGQWY